MQIRRQTTARLVALGTTALVVGTLGGTSTAAVASPAAHTRTSSTVPVVVARMSSSAIRLSVGHDMRAGLTIFSVRSSKGTHALQIARLHRGYTIQQAMTDLSKAFRGNVQAVRRVDHRITFRGGTATSPAAPGRFAVTLRAGRYLLVDQDSNATMWLRVHGTVPARPPVKHAGNVTVFTYGFATAPVTLPAAGWLRMSNHSDQPHFVEINRVKNGTTAAMVRRYMKGGAQGRPSWGLRLSTNSGVMSPNTSEAMRINMPAGEYLLACWWPDDETGMPHALMGMWKLVHLK